MNENKEVIELLKRIKRAIETFVDMEERVLFGVKQIDKMIDKLENRGLSDGK